MKALVYDGPGQTRWTDVPMPTIQEATDVIVKVSKTTICGTDLHILKGDVPEVSAGRILGHEGVGTIVEAGAAVRRFNVGDEVLLSCITACGICEACKHRFYSHCERGGWIFGHLIDGTQAEYVRVPFADTSLYAMPATVSAEAMVLLSDIFPTGFEIGVQKGRVEPGATVAIVGSGPVGMAALLTAQFYAPGELIMIDVDANRLALARRFGATATVNNADGTAVDQVRALTANRGVDVAIEAVGTPATFDVCQRIVTPGGHLANVGVFGQGVTLAMEHLWADNITLTTGLVDTSSTDMLIKAVQAGRLDPLPLITHHFALDDILHAYDVFGRAAAEQALKVILTAS